MAIGVPARGSVRGSGLTGRAGDFPAHPPWLTGRGSIVSAACRNPVRNVGGPREPAGSGWSFWTRRSRLRACSWRVSIADGPDFPEPSAIPFSDLWISSAMPERCEDQGSFPKFCRCTGVSTIRYAFRSLAGPSEGSTGGWGGTGTVPAPNHIFIARLAPRQVCDRLWQKNLHNGPGSPGCR
jgi:hypothetical protein